MFPLKTNIPVTRFAYGVWLIILINIVIYIYFRINFHGLLFADHGFLPLKLSMPSEIVSISEKMSSFFTYMFLHSSFLHTAVNMYFLYIFGKNVEEYLGSVKFVCLYIVLGVMAAITEAFMMPSLEYPVIGSSGAVAGIMGLFIIFFPFSKIKTFIFLLIYAIIRNIPAVIIILLFLIFQLLLWNSEQFFNLNKYLHSFQEYIGIKNRFISISNVAYWMHFGGFLSGVIIGIFIKLAEVIKGKSNNR